MDSRQTHVATSEYAGSDNIFNGVPIPIFKWKTGAARHQSSGMIA